MQCAIAALPSRAGDGRGDLAVCEVAAALQLSKGRRHLLHSGNGRGGLGMSFTVLNIQLNNNNNNNLLW